MSERQGILWYVTALLATANGLNEDAAIRLADEMSEAYGSRTITEEATRLIIRRLKETT